jgi:hypothetical protein
VANIGNCFIKSNVVIAPASGWLQRLVRPVHSAVAHNGRIFCQA